MKKHMKLTSLSLVLALTSSSTVFAADKKDEKKSDGKPAAAKAEVKAEEPKKEGSIAEEVDVNNIKEKYWARGEESELGVVQNRLYSKARKFEFSLMGGIAYPDPFLSVKEVGGVFGFHFNEYIAVNLVALKYFVSDSSARQLFSDRTQGGRTNTNIPKHFFGPEVSASVLYGKLSLLGKKIIYYDLHFTGGIGVTGSKNGSYITPNVGIGQQFYLSKNTSLKFDYRLHRYNEDIVEENIPTKLGQVVAERTVYNNVIMIGIGFMFGPGPKEDKK